MHTYTQNPSAHLSTVQELLAELDRMKNKGLGAHERLEFILDQGSNFVEEFDFEDAFDLEHRAMNKRLELLENMDSTLRTHRAQWSGAPVGDEVKEAAGKLIGHLDVFVEKARARERKSEIEMLSSLWTWAPDVSHIWPGHHSRPKPKAVEVPEEVKELLEKKSELYEELEAKESVGGRGWSGPAKEEALLPTEKGVKESREAPEETDSKLEPTTTSLKEKTVTWDGEDTRVVGKVSGELKPDPIKKEDGPDHLKRDAWTEALREMTTDDWKFIKEMEGLTGDAGTFGHVMLWRTSDGLEARLEIADRTSGKFSEGELRASASPKKIVTLWVETPPKRGFKKHSETMTNDEVEKLHLDPVPFIKQLA